jgi:UDP-N-acetylglucosamine 4,6-dehydratase
MILDNFQPERVIIFSRDEAKQEIMQRDFLPGQLVRKDLRYFIGDIRDKDRLKIAFKDVDIVIHAAALKQVPACEYNPFEAVQTNVLGAQNIIEMALENKVKKVIALSSDKAVDPINLYGATKLTAEKLFIASNTFSNPQVGPNFSVVRYGNVLGSRGSVLLTFMSQKAGGCLYLTDKRMTRFWITLDQAVEFVFNCVKDMKGGEIFVPQLPSCPVEWLAKEIAGDVCRVEETEIRPGEKLHEVMISQNEVDRTYAEVGKDRYVILPAIKFFRRKWDWKVSSGVEFFTSETNDWQLTRKDLRKLLDEATKELI